MTRAIVLAIVLSLRHRSAMHDNFLVIEIVRFTSPPVPGCVDAATTKKPDRMFYQIIVSFL